ncbi:hypothetical protein BAUCODRAFT_379125 [Baudoinia panamericana UAMH 10762]|uniref:Redoxin domain-containing protein n=1 Tax=Baudoinia panamericana (strain UAMH 10762) TaxID=717646 RepID=M2N419_BAUPA|nr:uncharacterized protein BAUCODRAFT_379125 [Baudoinia panamericana UAMH 10762]EMC98733.1 hypothetical protein BAUCODRAFT_379125 [Baudoinia panamericana UAMH 10762]
MANAKNPATPDWSTIPKPEDDGACEGLQGRQFPAIALPSTLGNTIDLSTLPGLTILFCYPRTAAPGENVPPEWNEIPGARGCTPQACSFRDASDELAGLGVKQVFGCSTQSTEYQLELKTRVHLPYELLSDEKLELAEALGLPVFEWEGKRLIKRLSMAVEDGKVMKVFYPVFPPDRSAAEVVEWLKVRG